MYEHEIEERCKEIAQYVIHQKATVRQAAKVYGMSKTTVHLDLVDRLPKIDARLAEEVRKVLDNNWKERHVRGGIATRRKHRLLKMLLNEPKG